MIYKIFDTLRTKPKSVRDQYAFGIAVICTFVIGGVWSLSLPSRFAHTGVAAASAASSTSPFSGLFGQIKKQFVTAKENIAPDQVTEIVVPPSIASTTADALGLQLSAENRADIASSSAAVHFSEPVFGGAAPTATPAQPAILIATSSATSGAAH